MWTTLITTLTILALTICSSMVVAYKLATRRCETCQMLQEMLAQEKALTRDLLGFQSPTPTMSPPKPSVRSPEPERDPLADFEGLSPEIQETLLREYREHLANVPRPTTINPAVEQITPGQIPPS